MALDTPHVSAEVFKEGMSRLAGAVNIVTTDGPAGRAGLTATAVCSVSADPPTLLVCVNTTGSAADAFATNEAVCINTIGADHQALAMLFGGKTPMDERFDDLNWTTAASGAPVLKESVVSFDCTVASRVVSGTHEVLFCEVIEIAHAPEAGALVYFDRRFHTLPSGA